MKEGTIIWLIGVAAAVFVFVYDASVTAKIMALVGVAVLTAMRIYEWIEFGS